MPAGQLVHIEAPASEYLPVPQSTQLVDTEAPVLGLLVPAAQFVHAVALIALQVPAGHVIQPLSAACPVSELAVPAGQLVQESRPVSSVYVPTAHAVQIDDAASENVPATQLVHT